MTKCELQKTEKDLRFFSKFFQIRTKPTKLDIKSMCMIMQDNPQVQTIILKCILQYNQFIYSVSPFFHLRFTCYPSFFLNIYAHIYIPKRRKFQTTIKKFFINFQSFPKLRNRSETLRNYAYIFQNNTQMVANIAMIYNKNYEEL